MKRRTKTDFLDSLEARTPPPRYCRCEDYFEEQVIGGVVRSWIFWYSDNTTEILTQRERNESHAA